MKVLVIDDEADVRYVVQASLTHIGGMTVVMASSGTEGIARAKSEQPDVILLDMMMPVMDGEATLRALREDAETARIPVVFLTATKVENRGAKGVLSKPFDPLTLPNELRALLDE